MTTEFFNQVTLDDTEAKGSYGIGLQIGQQLLDSQLAVKAEAVAKGIYDVLNQHAPALDFNEISHALQQLQQHKRQRLRLQQLRQHKHQRLRLQQLRQHKHQQHKL